MTRKTKILKLLRVQPQQTCAELTRQIAIAEKVPADSNQAQYLNGAVSSVLRKMVIAGDIQVIGHGGPRGGKCYCLTPKNSL